MSKLLMEGKRGLIMGLANDKSIAWGIAQALNEQGAQLAISYQNEALEKRVHPLAQQLDKEPLLIKCDVSDSESVKSCFEELGKKVELTVVCDTDGFESNKFYKTVKAET